MNEGRRDSAVVVAFKAKRAGEGRSRCEVCRWKPPKGLAVLHDDPSSMLHAHHVVPIACGGEDDERNLVLLCPTHHALAHKIGRMRQKPGRAYAGWEGPVTPLQLLSELRMLEKEPDAWRIYIESGRNFAALVTKKEGEEALARRARFTVSTTTETTTRDSEEISDAG